MHQTDLDIRNRLLAARLPAMPQILVKLIEQCQGDDFGMADLAQLIAKDAGMTAKILAVANSSAYYRQGQKPGLEQALGTLGTEMVKTLVISDSVFQIFNNLSPASIVDLRGFWRHSLLAALLAREIAAQTGYPHAEEAYLAGLLHDVGRLALQAVAPREYAFNFHAADDANLCAVEQRTLQVTHAEAGAWLIERWELDSFLADSVLYHHEPAVRLQAAHPLVRIVCLAHLLANPQKDDAEIAVAAAMCKVEIDTLAVLCQRADEQVIEAAQYLGINLEGAPVIAALEDPPPAVKANAAQDRLNEEVRNMVLAADIGRSFARQADDGELLDTIARSARILFNLHDAVVLLENPAATALVVTATAVNRQRLAGYAIALDDGGAIATAARLRQVAFVGPDGQSLGVAEEQLQRALGTDCIVCLPMVAGNRCVAMLLGAVHSSQLADLKKRERFMQAFGAQAAAAVDKVAGERARIDEATSSVAAEYREASRRVAHEVNNPLAIIKNYLSVLDGKLARQEPVLGEMSILNEEIDRVGQMINGFADLQPAPVSGATEIGRVVSEVVRLFRDTGFVPPGVHIEVGAQDQPCEIEGAADVLKQVLVNLLKNAAEAMPQGGQIEVLNNGYVNREGRLFFELCVSDTGPGLPPEVLANLFAPGYSTKDGAHRGLGLSIVQGLVKKLKGLITCRSNKRGTTFEILLPALGASEKPTGTAGSGSQARSSI